MRLTTKPGTSAQVIGCFLIAWAKLIAAVTVSGGGVVALDDLDQRHDRGRVEVVEADDLVGAQRRVADLGDRQRRGVRGEDRVAGRHGVELGEDGLLDLHPLGHGLDDEVDVAEALVGRRARGCGRGSPRPAASACSSVSLPFLTRRPTWPCGDVARLVEAGVDELLLDVLEDDGDAGGGDGLGDLAAHRPGADDGGLEHEHGAREAPVGRSARPEATSAARARSASSIREAAQRALQRVAHARGGRRARSTTASPAAVLELVVELERDGRAVLGGAKRDALRRRVICSSSTSAVWPARAS